MKIRSISGLGCLTALAALAAPAIVGAQTVVSFHDAFGDSFGDPPTLFVGQGAYADAGNNTWNRFAASGVVSGPASASNGGLTLINATVTFGFSNGGQPPPDQGLPDFLLGNSLVVNGANPLGTFTLQNVPPGSYDLYLYGTNYDHNRGSIFTVSSGLANGGTNATLNGDLLAYAEGVNFVIFHNVSPDANGTITGTWAPNPADGVGNPNMAGEGNFNALQLVGVPGSVGACCIAVGCAQSTLAACTSAAGTFHGVGTTCAAANCPLPGACCVGCAGCFVMAGAACTGAGSVYHGDGTACGTAGCGIVNGDFESGDFTGWTQFGDTSYTTVWTNMSDDGLTTAHGGTHGAEFGAGPPDGGGIQQVIPVHVGDQVTIGFWYSVPGGAPNLFRADFDGQTLVTFTDDTTNVQWTHFSYPVTVTHDNPTLAFTFYNVPSWGNLDDVTVCIPAPGNGGVCCRGATCNTTVSQANCTIGGANPAGARFVSGAATCNGTATSNAPCCVADYNKANGVTVQDIFDFLSGWFAGSPYSNTGGSGAAGALNVQNIFDFLTAWFSGGCA